MNDELTKVIDRVAVSVAAQWPEVATEEDVRQDIWVRIAESPRTAEVLGGLNGKALYEAVREMGHQVASKQRTEYEHFSGNFYYSTQDVREILSRGVLTEARERTDTERMDLEVAFRALQEQNERYAATIWARYVTGDFDKTDGSGRMLLTRAVDALTREMNRVHRHTPTSYLDRQKPSNVVTVTTRDGRTVTRELTQAEWDLTAKTYAKDLASYYNTGPLGGPGSKLKVTQYSYVEPEDVGLDEDGTFVHDPNGAGVDEC